ncbi:MAG: methylenetetrahydrofolate reductase [Alphaproteobacteria bacterium]
MTQRSMMEDRLAITWDAPPPAVSFEFFPPKTEKMEQALWQTVGRLQSLGPEFVSVTYGAGGSTRERTHATVARLQNDAGLKAAAHLTCVSATRDEVDAVAQQYWDAGIRHIVALRGDAPDGSTGYQATPGGYEYAVDLVAGLKRIADFEVSVAAYPENHPEAPNADFEIANLKRKIDAGATRAITQFFFDPEVFLRYRDKVAAAGISIPITPGILPVTNFATVVRFAKLCGAAVPAWLTRFFETLDQDPETRKLVAATIAAQQCEALRSQGVEMFHFYTLNRADLTYAICHLLGLRPGSSAQ